MKRLVFLGLLTLTLCSFTMHKYYISLTQIEHSTKYNSLQIQMRVFMDDIELAIINESGINLQLTTNKEVKESDSLLFNYVNNHFLIDVNGAKKTLNYIGKEFDGDAVKLYLEAENISTLTSLEITNNILIETYNTQENIVKIKANKTHKTFILDKKNDKGLLKF